MEFNPLQHMKIRNIHFPPISRDIPSTAFALEYEMNLEEGAKKV